MGIKIGSISIALEASTASFQAEMQKASSFALSTSRNIERSFAMMGAAITAATGSAIGALGLLINRTEDVVFSMQKMAQQAGVSMESFSKLAYAAKVAGMPVEDLSMILTRIGRSSFEAASGNKQAAAAYKELGVTVTDANGHFKTTDQIALALAKSLTQFKDSAAKTGIEMMVMGRSGAQAAELMQVLANRFDETSATAQKLGVVFTDRTAQGARQLHESLLELQEAGLGLSVRLLSQVSPALDTLAQKIVALMSNADTMHELDNIGKEIADGVTMAGDALEFLVKHFDDVKHVVEALIAIRVGGMFGPMIASAATTSDVLAKLGIASVNMTGNLLGIRRLGNVLAPVATGAKNYATALNGLAASEGVAATASLALGDALTAIRSMMATLAAAVPIATAAAGAAYEFGMAVKGIADYEALQKDTGASWWQIQVAEAEEAGSSAKNFFNYLKMIAGFKGASQTFYSDVAGILHSEDPTYKARVAAQQQRAAAATPTTSPAKGLKDLAPLPQEAKPDELAKRLADLTEKANAAQRALALVGASPQLQRDSEILEKYNTFLADEKFRLDQLTPAKRAAAEAAAHEAITNEVNFEAATKYKQALYDLSTASAISIQEHLAMAAAIGKSAQAMQDAAVAAQVSQEMQRAGGAHWQDNPQMRLDAEKRAAEIKAAINAENLTADHQTAANTQLQIDAQKRLNDAILAGADARREAAIISEQEAIRADFANRKDADAASMEAQIAAVRARSDAENEASDLQRASALDVAAAYQEQVKAIHDAAQAALAHGHAIDYRAVLAANKEAWIQFQEAQDKAILATGGITDGLKVAMQQMARDTVSAAQQMYDAVNQIVSTLNDAIAKVVTEHHQRGSHDVRNEFSGVFRGIGDSAMKTGLRTAESGVLKGLGLGKPDGTQSNPWYVRLVSSNLRSGGGDANELASLLHHTGGTSADNAGNGVGHVLGAAAKLLLPMFANGTDSVVPGMPSIVGERGPELFIPPSAGAIVPNSKLRNGMGHTITNHIDARGATDPAQTVKLINDALNKAAPQIIATSVRAVHEGNIRTPATRRR